MKHITGPLNKDHISKLSSGERLTFSGVLYTARDQAHKRLTAALSLSRPLPFDLFGQTIYYCGPTKTPKGAVIGSCGPTTSSRMDSFTLPLLEAGLMGMIGKGARSQEVITAIKKYKAVYFTTYAGCGALLSQYVKKYSPIAYEDLGPEAIYKMTVKDFPLIVAVDSLGRDIYAQHRFSNLKARIS